MANKENHMSIKFETKIDFKNPIWNRDAWARIQADLNPEKETICHCRGEILGVKPGEAVKHLLNFETFLATRLVPQEDGTIRPPEQGSDLLHRRTAPTRSSTNGRIPGPARRSRSCTCSTTPSTTPSANG